MSATRVPQRVIEQFREELRGSVLEPGQDGYDESRRIWNAMADNSPDLVVRPTGTADIVAAVTIAAEHDLSLSVKGGGHHVSGTAVPDEGLLLDLEEMTTVDVDPKRAVARVQAGATWGDVDHETQAFGLAVPGGQDPTIGVAGLTLGGGVGWLIVITASLYRRGDSCRRSERLSRRFSTRSMELFAVITKCSSRLGAEQKPTLPLTRRRIHTVMQPITFSLRRGGRTRLWTTTTSSGYERSTTRLTRTRVGMWR